MSELVLPVTQCLFLGSCFYVYVKDNMRLCLSGLDSNVHILRGAAALLYRLTPECS